VIHRHNTQPAPFFLPPYDDRGNVTEIEHLDGSGTVLEDFQYAYDAANQLTSETDNGTTTNYTYDATGQLTDAGATNYSYDANGNRTMAGYSTGTDNLLLSDGTWTYSYDSENNLISRSDTSTGITWTYGYDNRNALVWVEERAAEGDTLLLRIDYRYDAVGNRIEEARWTSATGTVMTRYTYDGDNLYADLDSSSSLITQYVRPQPVSLCTILCRISPVWPVFTTPAAVTAASWRSRIPS
jgi:YD repeat-containing protein